MTDGSRQIPVRLVLLSALFVLIVGLLLKTPCASGDWSDGRPYRRFCYTDIVPLYRSEGLAAGKFPYLQAANEYPVGTGLIMALTAAPVGTNSDFFLANALLLALAALVTAMLLYRMVGSRALLFALAPTLFLSAFLNWDLVPVALATGGTLAYLRRHDGWAGVLLGLGAAAKLYPALLVVPFVLGRLREGRRREAVVLSGIAAATWVVLNMPFAIGSYHNWTLFFRFNARRAVEWGTLWFAGCHSLLGRTTCSWGTWLSFLSLALFAAGSLVAWRVKERRFPDFLRWTFGFPMLVVLLLTTKVYSPQYSLWLLPWFALTRPDLRLFLAFEVADVAVFFTEFSWLGRLTGFGGLPVWPLELAVVARAAVLGVCLVAWIRRGADLTEGIPLHAVPLSV